MTKLRGVPSILDLIGVWEQYKALGDKLTPRILFNKPQVRAHKH
jgi:hypothetical protein